MAKKFFIAVDLGGTNLKMGLLDQGYRIITKKVLDTKSFANKKELISSLSEIISRITQEGKLKKNDLGGIGLGLPGSIDLKQGLVHFFPNIPGWKNVRLKKILEHKLRLPVFLDNDANLMCLAEQRLGAAKGYENAICLTLGTGVGAGLIVNGKLYRGSSFAAGEIGHIPINENGPKCNCGGRGCLELYVGNNSILREAKVLFGHQVSLEKLSSLAKENDNQAVSLWIRTATHLATGLIGVVNLLNPDVIVIGGGVANAGRILFDVIKREVRARAMPVQAKKVKIFKARLGNNAGLIGAAILVKEGISK